MPSVLADLAAALRSLRRAPGFSALALAMLALGIGANVAIFSIFRSIVLRPLPYAEPERLVGFTTVNSAKAVTMPALSAAAARDFRERTKSFAKIAAFRPDFASYAPAGGDPLQLVAAHVTEDFFATFGVQPFLGRAFHADEFSFAAPRTAVLSHAAWRRLFGERAGVIGETITLNDVPTTILGVMPESFREPEFVEVWLPFPPEAPENLVRDSRFWSTVGRLAPGVSLDAARVEVATVSAALAREFAATDQGWTTQLQPLLTLRVGDMRRSLLLLVGAVGLVLLVACVNLANLMLARGVSRLQELAVRLALGATPGRLARAVLTESLLLALLGGGAGVALAWTGLPVLARQLPAGLVPRSHLLTVDGGALLFALGAATLTGLVFGALPAWQVLRTNVNETLKSGGSKGGTSRFAARAQAGLIAGQVALTLVVLSGAALLVKSLLNLQRTPAGFDARDVLTVRLAPPPTKWETLTELAAYYDRALDEVRRVPGVQSAGISSSAPLCGITLRYPFWVQGRAKTDGDADEAVFNSVTSDFLRTLRIPVVQGRGLEERDDARAPKVCLVNQTLAKRLFGDANPLGQRLQTLPWLAREYREIVGVVADVKQDNLSDPPPAQIYVPQAQSPWFFTTLVVRVPGGTALTGAVQAALRRADPTASMTIRALEDNIARTATLPRLRTALFALFGAVALGLSAFGIYASMAFTVSQRQREIGVRMALGASPARVLAETLGRAGRLVAAGLAAGLVGAVALAQLLRGLLYGVEPHDPWVLAGLLVFVPLVALAASAHPAFTAGRLNPVQALQHE
ncbi:ABC transporter permease [Oleiharenicola sp. Vm1]|uniref:ABC transporter permease n=1 Tax=Oleiharenicola sp. Vm1 TaxID=3398393 RepID=UPI0039F5B08B